MSESLSVMSIHPISTLSKEIRKTIKDDLKTVEEVWDFLYMDLPISKKRYTSGTPVPNLTKQMSCIFIRIMYSNFHVDALTTLVKVLDWKRQRRRFVTCFRNVAVVLEQSQDFQNVRASYLDLLLGRLV